MTSPALKDLAVQIKELTFTDMMAFCDGLGQAVYQSGLSRAENVVKWADSVTKPDEKVDPDNPTPWPTPVRIGGEPATPSPVEVI
jgi:hypothetical protein